MRTSDSVDNKINRLSPMVSYGKVFFDDTSRLQEVLDNLNSIGGGILNLAPGVFNITRPLITYSNVSIEGTGNLTVINGSRLPIGDESQRPFLIRSTGTRVGELQFSTNLVEGQTILSVVGDLNEARNGRMLLIRSNERQYQGGGDHLPFKEELQKIVGVNIGGSNLSVDSGLLFDYTNQSTLRAEIYEPTSNINIKNLRINMGGVGSVHSGIYIDYGYNINLDNLIIDGAEHIGAQITRTYLFNIKNSQFLNSTSPLLHNFNSGYGVAIISSSCYGRIEHNTFDNCRHGITGGNHAPHHINVVSNLFTNCRIGYALGCHEPCMYWVMNGNTIQGCVSGINGRGMYLTISDNLVKNITGVGISVGGTEGLTLPFAKKYVITNNQITNTAGRAIELRGQFGPVEGAVIQQNTCIKTLGIFVRDATSLLIHNNIIDQSDIDVDTRYCIHLVACKNVTMLGNHLLGVGTHGIFSTDCDDVNISNNIFTPGDERGQILNGVIRAASGQKLIMTNNQFKNFTRMPVFTSALDHIIFVNNIITSNTASNSNFHGADNLINKDNMSIIV